jgi:hypothetical protein
MQVPGVAASQGLWAVHWLNQFAGDGAFHLTCSAHNMLQARIYPPYGKLIHTSFLSKPPRSGSGSTFPLLNCTEKNKLSYSTLIVDPLICSPALGPPCL